MNRHERRKVAAAKQRPKIVNFADDAAPQEGGLFLPTRSSLASRRRGASALGGDGQVWHAAREPNSAAVLHLRAQSRLQSRKHPLVGRQAQSRSRR